MEKKKVLFVCIHNSARSQMAEAFLNRIGKEYFEAESAGIEPGQLNPYVVEVMKEIGYDLSHKKTKSVFDLYTAGRYYDYVITVCDPEAAEKCPLFSGVQQMLHWSFRDPSSFQGSDEEKRVFIRKIRNEIQRAVENFVATYVG